jgi:energy-coupling factor transporter ATP-binding protein EcfA2
MSKISGDRAGSTSADDRYGWSTGFIPMLARVTRKWPAEEGLTFGLYGPWGSGKTTILNLLTAHLEKSSDDFPHTYVVRFNPWFYDTPKMLITSFFATMGETLKTLGAGQKWAEAGDLLKKVGKFLSVASKGISVVGVKIDAEAIQEASDAVSGAGELAEMANSGERTLQEAREKLVARLNELGAAGGRVMVLIDDVDRLNSTELFSLLRLLRTVADLPSITLVVAMDEHRVREVLDQAGEQGYGRAYLEKIVQAHLHVPIPPESVVEEDLRTGIVAVLSEVGAEIPESLSSARQHDVELYEIRVLNRIIRTPRDLGRYMNGLRLLTLAREEWDLNSEDAVHLAALQVFYPDVYDRVRRSSAFLTGSSVHEHLVEMAGTEEVNRARWQRRLNWLVNGRENAERSPEQQEISDLLSALFGDLEAGRRREGVHTTAERRISSPEVFGSYFDANLAPAWLPRSVLAERVEALVDDASAENLDRFSSALWELMSREHWTADPVLRADLPVALKRFSTEQLVQFATASLTVIDSTESAAWDVLWTAMLQALAGKMSRDSDIAAIRSLVNPVTRWMELSSSPTEAYSRLKLAHEAFCFFEVAANSLGQTWLTIWEQYQLSGRNPFEEFSPRWAVHLIVAAAQWERHSSREIGAASRLYQWIKGQPNLLLVIFGQLQEIQSSRVEPILENLVGGPSALAELVELAVDSGSADEVGTLDRLRLWCEKSGDSDKGKTKGRSPDEGLGDALF